MSEKLKIKVDLRKVESEKDSRLKGFADLTVGDVVIKNVAVKEFQGDKGAYIGFDMPIANKYESPKTGEMVYIPTAELSSQDEKVQGNLIKEVRKTIYEAYTKEEANEYGRYVAEKETDIDYDRDNIHVYTNPVENENYSSLRANGTIYLGGVLKLNQVRLTENINQENNETFVNINFPSRAREKDGETIYEEQVFPVAKGLREKMRNAMEESYLSELDKQSKAKEEGQEVDEEEDAR